jgi:hypothetical protein
MEPGYDAYLVQGRPNPLSIEYLGTSAILRLCSAIYEGADGREREERVDVVVVFVLDMGLSSIPP